MGSILRFGLIKDINYVFSNWR